MDMAEIITWVILIGGVALILVILETGYLAWRDLENGIRPIRGRKMKNYEWLKRLPDEAFLDTLDECVRDCETCWYNTFDCEGDCYGGHKDWFLEPHEEEKE